jgi:hypothetical protein
MIEQQGEEHVLSILGHLKNQLEYVRSLSSPENEEPSMNDDKIGCDCDYDEVIDAFWEEIQKKGVLPGEPMSQEYYDQAVEGLRERKELKARAKQEKETEGGEVGEAPPL